MAKKSRHRSAARAKNAATPGAAAGETKAGPPSPTVPASANPPEGNGNHASNTLRSAQPYFWFGFAIGWPKLVAFRFTVFMILAVDALLQISHAPRYGAGGFNVGQFAWLSPLAPGRTAFEIAQLTIALCCTAAAVGTATRVVVPLATGLYAWVYFSSQLDSYQHHYLVAMMLLLFCFVDWRRPDVRHPPRTRATTSALPQQASVIGGWPLRLLLIELAIMYFWAAISKTEASWLDGRTLSLQIHGSLRSLIEHTGGFGVAAKLVLVVELALAATIWHRRGWWLALPLGVGLHASILWSGLEIGLFAWLMLGLYVLLLPNRIFRSAANRLQRVAALLRLSVAATSATRTVLFAIAAITVAIAGAAFTRLPHAMVAGSAGAVGLTIAAIWQHRRYGRLTVVALLSPTLATLLWLGVDRSTDTVYDYYRFWAGSESRIGDITRAKALYRNVTVLFDQQENGFYQLAKLQIASGNPDEQQQAITHLHRAQQLAPQRARAFVAEAKLLNTQGKFSEALAKAQAGAAAEPTNVDALTLVRQLQAASGGPNLAPGNAMPTMPGKRPVTSDADDNDR